jgi:diguanylate cyclase (GGDEF)-like protein
MGLATATNAAERLRGAVEDLGIQHAASNGSSAVMTMSVGLAAWEPTDSFGPESVLGQADEALYEAKARGRNQVAVADATAVSRPRVSAAPPEPQHARL